MNLKLFVIERDSSTRDATFTFSVPKGLINHFRRSQSSSRSSSIDINTVYIKLTKWINNQFNARALSASSFGLGSSAFRPSPTL